MSTTVTYLFQDIQIKPNNINESGIIKLQPKLPANTPSLENIQDFIRHYRQLQNNPLVKTNKNKIIFPELDYTVLIKLPNNIQYVRLYFKDPGNLQNYKIEGSPLKSGLKAVREFVSFNNDINYHVIDSTPRVTNYGIIEQKSSDKSEFLDFLGTSFIPYLSEYTVRDLFLVEKKDTIVQSKQNRFEIDGKCVVFLNHMKELTKIGEKDVLKNYVDICPNTKTILKNGINAATQQIENITNIQAKLQNRIKLPGPVTAISNASNIGGNASSSLKTSNVQTINDPDYLAHLANSIKDEYSRTVLSNCLSIQRQPQSSASSIQRQPQIYSMKDDRQQSKSQ